MLLKRQSLSADRANNSMLVPLSLPFFYDSESSSPKQISFKLTFVSFKSELIIFSPIMKQSPKITCLFFFFFILPSSETLSYQNLLNPRELLSLLHIVKALIYKDIFSVFSHLRLTFF